MMRPERRGDSGSSTRGAGAGFKVGKSDGSGVEPPGSGRIAYLARESDQVRSIHMRFFRLR